MRPNFSTDTSYSHIWKMSLGCFITAALTGFLYRLGMVGWMNVDLGLENIRHAHSHLMFFGWAVPFPLYILMDHLTGKKIRASVLTWMKYSITTSLIFGILAYLFFLFYGYRPVAIGSTSLPLAAIFSGLVMFGWYGFAWGYWKARPAFASDFSLPWIDGAIILLMISSLGAWGVSLAQALDPSNYLLMKSLTHFFLAAFTEGWVILAIVVLLILKLKVNKSDWPVSSNFFLGCIVIGAPLTFPYGISESLLSPVLLAVARIGGGLTAIGLGGVVYVILKSGKWKSNKWIWIGPIALLGLKAFMQMLVSVYPFELWLSNHGLRILYLHIVLLGALTLTIVGWLQLRTSAPAYYFYGVTASITAVLVSLLLLTPFWPGGWSGSWILYVLAATALLPALAMLAYWIKIETLHYIEN